MTTPGPAHDPHGELPIDGDTIGGVRPVHLSPASIALVLVGGTVGTAAREALSLAIPPLGGIPVAIFAINVVGAFFLGVLLEALANRGPDVGRRRTLRLLLGTGFAGGFTTYSALAVDTGLLLTGGDALGGILYGLGTVAVGALATVGGITLAGTRREAAAR
ncbi:fluoride efflux transporter FluC [Microbacterium sp. NPDC077663]|uniref:fluoride efflux transporter FluC n=1 Tax=Microbacterium sp. NPDC077663 TaxID=3364189 RepID=UPI0037CB3236